MNNSTLINGRKLINKQYDNQRVIIFEDIDRLHKRSSGTAKRNFNKNKEYLIKGEDYFILKEEALDEFRTNLPEGVISKFAPSLVLIAESGYLMIVKSLQDDLAWQVQRTLVKNYFRVKDNISKPNSTLGVLRAALDEIEVAQREAREAKQLAAATKEEITNIRETIIETDEDWRNWVNSKINSIGFKTKRYREIRNDSYEELENRGKCRLSVRLSNLRDRLRENGATKTEIKKANKLDVIENDIRLKEIYAAIVKEMAIKYSA
ncbi:ORF6N domain-containing protein [Orenia marismortui]|uniref:ORF6N domain-containing protein n=1 Tax=Orenia marismortui TaxID=46469 RepID=UPI00036EAA76|nr:ORF6N domain-containing protein [Orenia marismortui]